MKKISPAAALYYPHAQFGSTAWVKTALLFWERVARLVGNERPDDDPEIRVLQNAGMIVDIETEPYRPSAVLAFGEVVENIVREHGQIPTSIPPARGLRGRATESIASARDDVARRLDADGRTLAAATVRSQPDHALAIYATIASGVIAEDLNLAPATDDPLYTALAMLRNMKVARPNKSAPQTSWGTHMEGGLLAAELLIPVPSPDEVGKLSVDRLVEIRGRLSHSRRALRESVESHTRAIASLPSAEAIQQHLQTFAEQVKQDVNASCDALKTSKSTQRMSTLRFTAPVALAVGVVDAAAFPILTPIVGSGLMGLGLAGWLLGRRLSDRQEPAPHGILELQSAVGMGGTRGLEGGLNRLFGP
jgi:hypothetical protein